MFKNLEAELARKNLARKDIAELLGVGISAVSEKLAGKTAMRLEEAKKIKDFIGTDMTLEELFEVED